MKMKEAADGFWNTHFKIYINSRDPDMSTDGDKGSVPAVKRSLPYATLMRRIFTCWRTCLRISLTLAVGR